MQAHAPTIPVATIADGLNIAVISFGNMQTALNDIPLQRNAKDALSVTLEECCRDLCQHIEAFNVICADGYLMAKEFENFFRAIGTMGWQRCGRYYNDTMSAVCHVQRTAETQSESFSRLYGECQNTLQALNNVFRAHPVPNARTGDFFTSHTDGARSVANFMMGISRAIEGMSQFIEFLKWHKTGLYALTDPKEREQRLLVELLHSDIELWRGYSRPLVDAKLAMVGHLDLLYVVQSHFPQRGRAQHTTAYSSSTTLVPETPFPSYNRTQRPPWMASPPSIATPASSVPLLRRSFTPGPTPAAPDSRGPLPRRSFTPGPAASTTHRRTLSRSQRNAPEDVMTDTEGRAPTVTRGIRNAFARVFQK